MVPTSERYDVVIIGGGPAGYAAALHAGLAGMRVALVEKDKVGGTCLHRGCIPAKELLETASVFRTVAGAKEFGIATDQPVLEMPQSQARKARVVGQLHKGLAGLLKRRKVTVIAGTGTLGPGRRVSVAGGADVVGDAVVLATGSVPRTIPGFEVDGRLVLTSDELLDLQALPPSAAVIGGGAIGCEFASLMADLGTRVTILEALPKILPGCDSDVAGVVLRSFSKRGIAVRTGVPVTGHRPAPDGATTTVSFGAAEEVTVEAVVVSVGRRPLSEGLVSQGTGVRIDGRGFVEVDEWMRTGEEGVYACGDLVATPALAHVGFAEGMLVIDQLLGAMPSGRPPVPVDYARVPWCIYT
ncbi:MAG: FAD-dependent oxidoreductase, partial [Candidatus Dormibacteria bacterium]